jgi:hypothetical protein
MNQNILIGLERQAEKLVLQIPAALDSNEYTSLFNEKFAELILQDVMNLFGDEILSLHYLEQECCKDSVYLLKSKIQEHFGI